MQLALRKKIERERRRRFLRKQADLLREHPLAYLDQRFGWTPNRGPQTEAFLCEAEIIGYGGAGGGGKTLLALMLAAARHKRSVLFRQTFPNSRDIIEKSRDVFGKINTDRGNRYNGQEHIWRLRDEQLIEISSVPDESSRENQRGRERDFYNFDEATEFSESAVRFIIGWNRSPDPYQLCQVLLTFNPPMEESGDWVVKWFLPWLAFLFPDQFTHPRPAKPGEIRWFIQYTDEHGADHDMEIEEEKLNWYIVQEGERIQVESGELRVRNGLVYRPRRGCVLDGQVYLAKSRTFFPAKLKDNPTLEATGYDASIDALPEPMRSLMKGKFLSKRADSITQVIPTEWIRLAQKRWLEQPRPEMPMTALGVDVARGNDGPQPVKGDDNAIAPRYGNWYAPLKIIPGVQTPNGGALAQIVMQEHKDEAAIIVDAIGVGSSPIDYLNEYNVVVHPLVASAKAVDPQKKVITDRSKKLRFRNVRAAMWWKMREMLDPDHGDDIALPPDEELAADLAAPRWRLTSAGLLVEDKADIKLRLHRSTNRGDAVVMAGALEWLFAEQTAEIAVGPQRTEEVVGFASNFWKTLGKK
jgi:hypothetical protein